MHTGRFDGSPAAARICWICADGIEDERHFLLECELYRDGRARLWTNINRLVDEKRRDDGLAVLDSPFDASRLSTDEQFTLLTGGSHPLIAGAVLERRVMSAVLIVIAQWMNEREEKVDELKRANACPID